MLASEIIKKYGLEHYFDANNTHYVVVPREKYITESDAMRAANHYFKVNSARLAVNAAWAKGEDLYFQKKMSWKPVWAVEIVR